MRNVLAVSLLLLCAHFSASAQNNLAEPDTPTFKKAKSLIIKEVKFNELPLSDVLEFFKKESVAEDPDKNGLNFVLKTSADAKVVEPMVTMTLRNVPLSELLKYVASMTGYHVKFEQFAIVLTAPVSAAKSQP